MSSVRRFVRRLGQFIGAGRGERELAKEVDAHLSLLEQEYSRRGLPPDEARRAARRAFGNVESAKEQQRDARSFTWMEDLRRDIAYGSRALARTPGFTAVAVITLALGIGAVTVIYSVLRNVVLDPFPYSRSDRMVNVLLKDESDRIIRGPYFPAAEFLDYEEQAAAFEDVVGTSRQAMHWTSESSAERLMIAWMTPNGFTFLGVGPQLGRVFGAADAAPGAPPVGVLNHRTWVRLFGADPGVIGRTLVLDGEPRTIIGVMPPRFEWNIVDLWLPSSLSRSDDPRSARGTRAFQAHLRPGVTPQEAEAQLNVIAARRAAEHPGDYPPKYRFQVITVIDWVVREFRGVLYTLFGAVSLLLMIACCNVANMLLARATTREREISIRVAIGASRGRIVRQLLVESALLALGGLLAGCLFAYAGVEALASFMPRQGVPWETTLRVDQPVLLFALFAAALATVGFGLFPALQSARQDLGVGTNIGGRSGTAGRGQTRMRSSLVVAQVALSIVLLLGAGLLMRTFIKLVGVDLGFDPRNVLMAGVALPRAQEGPDADHRQFQRDVIDRVQALPGVVGVAVSSGMGTFIGLDSPLEIPGAPPQENARTLVQLCSEGLLDTLGLRLLSGRQLSASEAHSGRKVAIVNHALATRYFGGLDAVGREIRLPRLASLSRTDPGSNVRRDWRRRRCEEPEHPGSAGATGVPAVRPSPVNCPPHHRAHDERSGTVQRRDRSRGARGQSAGRAYRARHARGEAGARVLRATAVQRARARDLCGHRRSARRVRRLWRSGVYGVPADARDCDSDGARRRSRPRRADGRPPRPAPHRGGPRDRGGHEPPHEPTARQPALEHVTTRSDDLHGRTDHHSGHRGVCVLGAGPPCGSRRTDGRVATRIATAATSPRRCRWASRSDRKRVRAVRRSGRA